MAKYFLIILITFLTVCVKSQTVISLDTVGQLHQLKTNYVKLIDGDSLSSSFCILIPNEVKPHKHLQHSEQVCVLEGEGEMKLATKIFKIKKGDLIFIPKNTVHSVKSLGKKNLKVLSIQCPNFDGTDRVMVNE